MNKAAVITGVIALVVIIVIVFMYNKKVKALTPPVVGEGNEDDEDLDASGTGSTINDGTATE